MGLLEHERAAGGTADDAAVGAPLVADRAQPVGVGQRVAGGQRLALRRRASDRHTASGRVVDVGHQGRRRAGHALGGAAAVGVVGDDDDRLADLGLAEQQRAAGGAADRCAVGKPLVADRAQPVDIGQRVRGRERLALRGRAADGHAADGCVVEGGHCGGRSAGLAFCRAKAVGVAGRDRDRLAHLS